ncbi:hypothetical protein D3C74_91890 [compost metagenome]
MIENFIDGRIVLNTDSGGLNLMKSTNIDFRAEQVQYLAKDFSEMGLIRENIPSLGIVEKAIAVINGKTYKYDFPRQKDSETVSDYMKRTQEDFQFYSKDSMRYMTPYEGEYTKYHYYKISYNPEDRNIVVKLENLRYNKEYQKFVNKGGKDVVIGFYGRGNKILEQLKQINAKIIELDSGINPTNHSFPEAHNKYIAVKQHDLHKIKLIFKDNGKLDDLQRQLEKQILVREKEYGKSERTGHEIQHDIDSNMSKVRLLDRKIHYLKENDPEHPQLERYVSEKGVYMQHVSKHVDELGRYLDRSPAPDRGIEYDR